MSIRKTALEALKTKYEGIDEKVLSRMAAKIAKTAESEDEAKEEVEGLTLQGIIDSYVDSRVAEGTNTAIENYEKKHGLKDGKQVGAAEGDGKGNNGNDPNPDPKPKNEGDDIPAWAKKLMEDIGALKASKAEDKRKSALDKLLKDVPEDKRKSFVREFSRATFKDDEDFDAWIEEITPDVEAIASDHKANGSTTGSPKGGGGNTPQVNAIVQQRADARKAETEAPAIKGLPQSN